MRYIIYIKIILISIIFLFLMLSCKEDGVADNEFPDSNREVQFIALMPKDVKTTLSTSFKTIFNVNDAIGIYAVRRTNPNAQAPLAVNGNYAQNCKWIYQSDGTWAPATTNDVIYYPNNGDKLDFYAYYPYNSSMVDPTSVTFDVALDQAASVNFTDNDLLASINSTGLDIKNTPNPVPLQFDHKLSLVRVVVSADPKITFPAFNSNLAITLTKAYPRVVVNLGTKTSGVPSGTASEINLKLMSDGSFCAIIPAQDLPAISTWFDIKQDIDFDFKYTFPSNAITNSGKVTQWDLTLGWEVVP